TPISTDLCEGPPALWELSLMGRRSRIRAHAGGIAPPGGHRGVGLDSEPPSGRDSGGTQRPAHWYTVFHRFPVVQSHPGRVVVNPRGRRFIPIGGSQAWSEPPAHTSRPFAAAIIVPRGSPPPSSASGVVSLRCRPTWCSRLRS